MDALAPTNGDTLLRRRPVGAASKVTMRPALPLLLFVGAVAACGSSQDDDAATAPGASATASSSAGTGGAASTGQGGDGGEGGAPNPGLSFGFVDLTESIPPPFDVPAPPDGEQWIIDTAGLFADVDEDGTTDVVLFHVTNPGKPLEGDLTPKRYHYDGSSLVLDGPFAEQALLSGGAGVPRALLDLDGDGHLDLLTAVSVSWGLGGGQLAPPAMLTGPEYSRGAVESLDVADLDADGWLDVLIGGGKCDPDGLPLYPLMRTGLRSFDQREDYIVQPVPGRSFAVITATIEDERVAGTLFSSCFNEAGDPPPFYRLNGDHYEVFDLLPPEYLLNSPMGAAMGDLDGDGVMDLCITEDHDFFQGGSIPLTDVTETAGFKKVPSDTLIPMIPWGVALLDLDYDGQLDVVTVHGNDAKAWFDPGWQVGQQWTTVHRSLGGFRFEQVDAGLGRKGQWKTLSVGDLEGDGDPDLIVGGGAEIPRVYRNDIEGGRGIVLELRGTTSNPIGNGAIVDVWPAGDEPAPRRYVAGGRWSPAIVSQPLVFATIGDRAAAARVRVTWPSGTVQELAGLPAGRHVVDEPPVLEVSPAGRHVPAGSGVATIHVTPRADDRSAHAGRVLVTLKGGGTASAVTPEGEGYRVDVAAPAAAGSSVVEVTIDGALVGVAPRIWWD
jgi:hypothetical protein